jgi:sec-independent protein translocase protein TatC
MTLVEHLTELRNRLVIAGIAVGLGGILGFFLYEPVLRFLQEPYCDIQEECAFLVTNPVDSFALRLKVSAYIGLFVASPVVFWQIWRFVTPGLYDREKRYAVPFMASSVVLFALGAGLAFWTIPKALQFFVDIGGGANLQNPEYELGKYLSLVLFMMLAFGAGFEFPVLLVFLQLVGVLTWQKLASWRRYAIVLIFIVDAVITPSGDPVSLFALAVPMIVFYEAAILIGRFALKRS